MTPSLSCMPYVVKNTDLSKALHRKGSFYCRIKQGKITFVTFSGLEMKDYQAAI